MAYTNKEVALKNIADKDFSSELFDNFRDDKDVVLEAVKLNGLSLEWASDRLKDDKEVAITAFKTLKNEIFEQEMENIFQYENLVKEYDLYGIDKEIKYTAIDKISVLPFVSERLKNDKDFVLELIKSDIQTISWVSDRLKDDKDVVMEVLNQTRGNFRWASDKLKDDKAFVLEAVSNFGDALQYASPRLQDDKEVVLEAVRQDGTALKYASLKHKDDKEIVLVAVKQHGWALGDASKRLRDDKEVVLVAVKSDVFGGTVDSASKAIQELCKNKDPVKALETAIEKDKLEKELTHKAPEPVKRKVLKI